MMKKINIYITAIITGALLMLSSCQEDEYRLGDLITPSSLELSYTIVGADESNPNGDGSGLVNFKATADNAITFNYIFGDGKNNEVVPDGNVTHLFSITGVNKYNVTVYAVGTGGITSSKTIQVEVLSTFSDDEAVEFLTGGSTKIWYWAADQLGHAGMGPQSDDYGNLDYTWPNWWSAAPFEKTCMYDAEFVFTKTGKSVTFEQTTGPAFIPGGYAAEIGVEGDVCHGEDVVPTLYGVKNVSFSPSSSRASIDGNYRGTTMNFSDGGVMCWYVGISEYDIIELTENILRVRIKENETQAWYHIFTPVKPEQ